MSVSIQWFEETDSTNSRLSANRDTLQEGCVYAAKFQTAGRGQKGNRWESKAGDNLTFSLLLKPDFLHVTDQFAVSQAVALGIVAYLADHNVEATVKWPNDIYVGDKKICGTLIENSLSGDYLSASVVGVGLNLNQKSFDPSIPNPTSLSAITGRDYDLDEELAAITCRILESYEELKVPHSRNYLEVKYMERLYRRGQWHQFEEMPQCDIPTEHRSGNRFTARILGIDPNSRLILERTDGTTASYWFKEIKYII